MFWPSPSPASVFAERRVRLRERFVGPLALASGLARVRNMQSSFYPFRAESHFLYLVGRPIEGALLLMAEGRTTLYLTPPEPGADLWRGPEPSFDELGKTLEIEVRSIDDFEPPEGVATLEPQDEDSREWLVEILNRDVGEVPAEALDEADRALGDAMIELRLRHDPAAIAQLRQAAEVTVLAHRAGMRSARPGLYEAAVMAAMQQEILGNGMQPAYAPIVTVHGEVLHCERYDNTLAEGDLLLADVGAETPEGWAGDVTRTWPVSGRFSGSQRAIYEVVLAAQWAAIERVKPGARYLDVHRAAARALAEGLLALGILRGDLEEIVSIGVAGVFFPHGVGHLLGLDVHDLDDLGDRATYAPGRARSTLPGERYLRLDRDLEPGMVVTIEPGFYQVPSLLRDAVLLHPFEPFLVRDELARYRDVRGIRIEDDLLVTPSGHEILSDAIPKTLGDLQQVLTRS